MPVPSATPTPPAAPRRRLGLAGFWLLLGLVGGPLGLGRPPALAAAAEPQNVVVCESLPGGLRTVAVKESEWPQYRTRSTPGACPTATPTPQRTPTPAPTATPGQPATPGRTATPVAATVAAFYTVEISQASAAGLLPTTPERLSTVSNRAATVSPGEEEGEIEISIETVDQEGYFSVRNHTEIDLQVVIKYGTNVLGDMKLSHGGTLWWRPPSPP